MIASDFVPPRRPQFPPAVRAMASIPLYAIAVPIVKTLEVAGLWPKPLTRAMKRMVLDFGEYQANAHDVMVCAGFKSGTTWMLQVVTQIAFRGEADFENIHSVVPWPDCPGPYQRLAIPLDDRSPANRSPTGLRAIKTHLRENRVPYSPDARYICVVRDPKDIAVSSYHFVRALAFGPMMPRVRRWVETFIAGDAMTGSWAKHLASYWKVRDRPNLLFLTYESMKADPAAAIDRVAAFMGVNLKPAERAEVIRRSSFAYMKEHERWFDPGRIVPWGGENYMLRKGASGNSGELLTPELQRLIDDACRAELLELGCDFPYDRCFGKGRADDH